MTPVTYSSNVKITADDFIDLLKRSTLAERRPVHDPSRIRKMLDFANVIITAWQEDLLVGVSRAVTDFSFCCYLSDLAVDERFQHQGIGKELVQLTHEAAGMETQLILLAAPKATKYYPKIGMKQFADCFIFDRKK
jgi:ribosomal protein S18 acetylase RimI-like enzyme